MQQLCVGGKLTCLAVLLQPVLLPTGEGARWCIWCPPHTSCLLPSRGKGAANALMLVLHPPYMWARLTAYLRWLTLLRTRRDKGWGSQHPLIPYAYVDASVFKHLSSKLVNIHLSCKQHNIQLSCFWHFVPPPLGGRVDMHGVVKRRHWNYM